MAILRPYPSGCADNLIGMAALEDTTERKAFFNSRISSCCRGFFANSSADSPAVWNCLRADTVHASSGNGGTSHTDRYCGIIFCGGMLDRFQEDKNDMAVVLPGIILLLGSVNYRGNKLEYDRIHQIPFLDRLRCCWRILRTLDFAGGKREETSRLGRPIILVRHRPLHFKRAWK